MSAPRVRRASLALASCLCACTHIGPSTIPRDRFDYSSAITDSWKRQTLLNIVKLRYMDPPIFVDIGQIIAGYTLETGINASAANSGGPPGAAIGGNSAALAGSIRYTDRPTITYVPMTGNKFVRGLMTPLPPESLFQAIAASWPADGILAATVNAMNGLSNQRVSLQGCTPPDPRFLRVLQLMREIQDTGDIGLRVRKDAPAGSMLLVFRRRDTSPENIARSKELRELLGLAQDAEDFTLSFGATAQSDKDVAVATRSVLHILMAMSMGVEVPDADVRDSRATPGLADDETKGRLVRIHCDAKAPDDAYVTVDYRGHQFWIDDRDLRTKRAFAFMMMLFTLSDPTATENAPVVTIPG